MSGGLILAAANSGSGKTLLTLGLLRHLAGQGVSVAAAKSGPDYIDPTWHAAACGRPSINLDAWAMREASLAALADGLERSARFVICEGAMGLFDGIGPAGRGSTADLAMRTGWPVILVLDVRGMGASVAALARGFASHRRDLALAGLVLNQVAGPRQRDLLTAALAATLPQIPVLGAMLRDAALALPARHLGLVPAGEAAVGEVLDVAARRVGAALDVPALLALARPGRLGLPAAGPGSDVPVPVPPLGRRIAVARDAAFAFVYPALLAGWRRAGAEIAFFSPLDDAAPDPAADAVYLPGGYPELHAGRLAGNRRFLAGLRGAANRGAAVYGECGGYMVLGEGLIDAAGRRHAMAGLLPLVTSFAERRLHLGYRILDLAAASPLGPAGTRFRGHEFHYASILAEGAAERLGQVHDGEGRDLGPAGLRCGAVAGSFIHLVEREAG